MSEELLNAAKVRKYLSNLSSQRVTDSTIDLMIRMANDMVEKNKSRATDRETLDNAKLAWAGFLTYKAYVEELERSVGIVPAPSTMILGILERIANEYLSFVKRGETAMYLPAELTETAWKLIEDAC